MLSRSTWVQTVWFYEWEFISLETKMSLHEMLKEEGNVKIRTKWK